MDKNQAIALINRKQSNPILTGKNSHWANVSAYGNKEGWWLNVPFNKFSEDLYFILNDKQPAQLFFVTIPKNSISNPQATFRNKGSTADIFIPTRDSERLINTDLLIDTQSNGTDHNFSRYQVELIDYSATPNNIDNLYPEEVSTNFREGSRKKITVNSYERNTKARNECIKKYGANCAVCDFNFKNTYGTRGEGFIHVHHITPVSDIGDEYTIDPVTDLRPVCPNCHAMLHRRGNISIEELMIEIGQTNKG